MAEDGRNRLAGERSPFLQHGATQPVDWHPWGEAAFERARAERKPVLLDIGAVWCHWCHVMDRESYEDPETAALINELFVPVKVDRDERPDVDARYQRAVQLMTGQGGWPLTAVLTGEGEVFYGGTYFPPEDMPGRPAFRRVLREVARVWRDEPERAAGAATQIRTRLQELAEGEAQAGEPRATLLDGALEELADSFDFRHGGFGRAPKFPHAGGLDLLLDEWADRETDWARRIVAETLDAMARGGIHDQLGGGFHRYSTDARWLVPHFEKMAYDNGALLETFARAAAAFGDDDLASVAAGIVSHYRDVAPGLLDAGGFPASQDADVGADDGDYWTWTEAELRETLADDALAKAALLHFGFDDRGARMHLDPDRHVLFRARPPAEVAERLGIDAASAADRIERARALLKTTRDRRPRPYVDETLYTGWVAMVASGFLAADRFAGVSGARADAVRALERIWREAWHEERGLAHTAADPEIVVLEDQSLAALALLDAWEVTQEPVWLERAAAVAATMLRRFATPGGALADRPNDADGEGMLGTPHLPIADAPSPSGNGAAALALQRLYATTAEQNWADGASGILRAFAGSAARLTSSAATYMKALAWSTRPVTTIVVVGDGEDAGSRALLQTALRTFRPRTVVRRIAAGDDVAVLPPEVRAMLTGESPRAYVCAGRTCAPPVADSASLETLLRTFRN